MGTKIKVKYIISRILTPINFDRVQNQHFIFTGYNGISIETTFFQYKNMYRKPSNVSALS